MDYDPAARHSCRDCDNRWNRAAEAHCASCHRTFADVDSFDHHQSWKGSGDAASLRCKTPSRSGMAQVPERVYQCFDFRNK